MKRYIVCFIKGRANTTEKEDPIEYLGSVVVSGSVQVQSTKYSKLMI